MFATRCSKCHTLARPLSAKMTNDGWKSYIKKMIRKPGSGINEEAGKTIYDFLRYYGAQMEAIGKAAAPDIANNTPAKPPTVQGGQPPPPLPPPTPARLPPEMQAAPAPPPGAPPSDPAKQPPAPNASPRAGGTSGADGGPAARDVGTR